ncbi:MAG: EAL domain-containing protein [Luteimonas sp.]
MRTEAADSHSRLAPPVRRMLAYGLLLLVSLAVALGIVLWHDRVVRHRHGQAQVNAIVGGAERELRRELEYIERDLTSLADVSSQVVPGIRPLHLSVERVAAMQRRNPDLLDVHLAASLPDLPGLQAAGSDPSRSRGRMRVGHPVQRSTQGWVLPLAVPVETRAGGETAWIVGSLRIASLERIAAGLSLGSDGIANIIHRDGQVVVRSRDQARWVGRSLLDSELFKRELPRAANGTFELTSVLDGKPRLAAYRSLPQYPLVVISGVAHADMLAGWFRFAATASVLVGMLALLWLYLLWVLMRSRGRHLQLVESLRRSATQLKETRRIASLGHWRWELDTGWVTWSEEIYRIYGLPPRTARFNASEVPGQLHPDDRARVKDYLARLRAGGDPSEIEYRILRADSAVRTVYSRGEWTERTPGHRVLQGIQQDVTEVASIRERLRVAQDVARVGDWEWDIASGDIVWSDTIYDIYGLDPYLFKPRADTVFEYIHAEDRGAMRAYAAALIETGTACEAEFRVVRPDGDIRVLSCRGVREIAPDGRVILRSVQQDITTLAHARDQLREAEAQYRFLFQHNPMPMWVFDRETLAFLAVNDAMLASYGYPEQELLSGRITDIRPRDEASAVESATRLAAEERPQGRVWTHLRKDGSSLRAAIHTRDILFGGRPARLVLAQDVTEQERSEQRFQLVARATSDAVWDWDLATGVTWRSENVYPLFGYAPGEFGPSLASWGELLHGDDRERVMTSVQHGIDSGATEWEERYQLRRKDGSYAQVLDRGFILRDERGHALRAVGGMVDVSEKHQQDTDLRLLRRAVESTENGIVIADARLPDLPVVYVNAAFERITGYSAEEAVGRNCRFLQGEDRDQAGRHEISRGIANGREARALLRNYRKDGTEFWNDLHINPVRDEAGVITHFVGVQNDVSERQRQQAQIVHRATHDELTGLPNRTLLLDRLQQAIASAARFGRGVGVAFVDLDNFKLINDGLGHAAGDLALRAVAGALLGCVRDADTVSRFGGDEFVLVISEQADSSGAASVIKRVQASFAEPLSLGGSSHYLSSSIGYACYPEHGDDAETLLMHADIAMYEAKQAGRNRVMQYRAEFDAVASERLHLITRLRQALVREEFVLHFQPLFSADGSATGMEALVRWQHPEQGLLPPGRFIGACENSGLIVELGRWVLGEAARHHALLAQRGLGHLTISINVSALQFQAGLLTDVEDAIALHALPRGALEIELTESAVMADPESAIAIMNRLNALGVTIAVDDFGTGYSSLAYLKRLPISRLKIDRSFVRDLGQDEDDEAICTSIITLARSLDLGTVAEGVETVEQRNWLLAQGCDQLQGFLLARPAPFDVILDSLAAETVGNEGGFVRSL